MTINVKGDIINLVVKNISFETQAEVAELADAQDLKSCGPYRPYRFDSGLRHHKHRGIEQLVARRAHNPEVVGSSPTPATNLKLISLRYLVVCTIMVTGIYMAA